MSGISVIEDMKPDNEHDRMLVTFSRNGERVQDTIDEHTRLIPCWFDTTSFVPLPESELKIVTCSPEGEQKVYWIAGEDIPKFLNTLHREKYT